MINGRKVIMIIGSTRFIEDMRRKAWELTRRGNIVLLPEERPKDAKDIDINLLESIGIDKIDFADEVLLFNKNGYIGESTSKEIVHILSTNKKMVVLEEDKFYEK